MGVVTALEMRLYPVGELYAGNLFFPIQRAAEVLHAWRAWTGTVPDEVTSTGRILRFPPLPEVPKPFRGRAFVMVEAAYLGDADTGAELTRPLRLLGPELDTFAMIPAPALGQLNMDPDQPVPSGGDGAFLADLPAAAIEALVTLMGPDAGTPLLSAEVRHLGGALARPAPGGGAQPSIDANYLIFAVGVTPTPELAATVRQHAQAVKEALAAWHASYDDYNFEDTPAPASAVLPPASYRRLQEIKAAYDPDQAIISAHPVWPAHSGRAVSTWPVRTVIGCGGVTSGAMRCDERCYEICVGGRLGDMIRSAFPDLRVRARGGDTTLSGVLADQAALYGVLAQLEALGLELIEVRRLPPT